MGQDSNLGPLGCDTNQPAIDGGTSNLTQCRPPPGEGPEWRAAEPLTPFESLSRAQVDMELEFAEAAKMLVWWVIGSPALGAKNGDLEFGPGDSETTHLRNTPAYLEAVEIYRDWLANGRPLGKFVISGTECEWVPSKGYFFVQGRTGGGRSGGSKAGGRGNMMEPLIYPLWGFTGNFSIRFTETGWPSEGYVNVEMENYTSLPSYLHGIDDHHPVLDELYTKSSGWPILSRSRQVYRFRTYIAAPPAANPPHAATTTAHTVVAGDSLSKIALAHYGDLSLWPIIFNANRATIGPDFNMLRIGQVLTLPSKESLTPAAIQEARAMAQRTLHTRPVPVAPPR